MILLKVPSLGYVGTRTYSRHRYTEEFLSIKHCHREMGPKIKAGGVGKQAGNQKQTIKSRENLRTQPRPEGDLHQSPYRISKTLVYKRPGYPRAPSTAGPRVRGDFGHV